MVVDRETCIGSGVCVLHAPHTFAHDDEAVAVVVDPDGDPAEAVATAVEGCPTGALRLTTPETEE